MNLGSGPAPRKRVVYSSFNSRSPRKARERPTRTGWLGILLSPCKRHEILQLLRSLGIHTSHGNHGTCLPIIDFRRRRPGKRRGKWDIRDATNRVHGCSLKSSRPWTKLFSHRCSRSEQASCFSAPIGSGKWNAPPSSPSSVVPQHQRLCSFVSALWQTSNANWDQGWDRRSILLLILVHYSELLCSISLWQHVLCNTLLLVESCWTCEKFANPNRMEAFPLVCSFSCCSTLVLTKKCCCFSGVCPKSGCSRCSR